MIRQEENWKAFIVENQAHYNQTNEKKFNLIAVTPEERGWTELFQVYPPITRTGGSGTSPVNGRSYSWTYGFLPVGYFGAKNQSRVFTSSDTWTCPADVNEIYVRCIAPGGAGGNGVRDYNSLQKGGGGGGFIMAKISTTPGNNYAVSISSGLTSFGGVLSATAGNSGANGGTGGSFTHTETPTILFTGAGGDGSSNGGGGGGGSELGKGGNGGGGGGGLHSPSVSSGGGGMLGGSSSAGAGFKSPNANSNGGGMFASNGIKKPSSPYYDKLSAEITQNLGSWGSPGNYGGGGAKVMFSGAHAGTSGKSATKSSSATNGGNAGYGGFGGGGGGGGRGGRGWFNPSSSPGTGHKPGANAGTGGAGGYGGGGGAGGTGGDAADSTSGAGNTGSPGGAGGGGGSGGDAGISAGAFGRESNAGNGAAGGYGGGGGRGGRSDDGTLGTGGAGGAGLVIIEW